MSSTKDKFEYATDLTGFRAPGWLVVRLGGRLRRKQDLLRAIADGLTFPEYFGWNWDALEECLRDLSWIDAPGGIVLVHEHLPLANASQRRVYLDILRKAQANTSTPLRVLFPHRETRSDK
jgi:RNAse (barnase) inhibitor barstar